MPALPLPLAPVAAPGATAAAVTAAAATLAYVGQQLNGFRAPLPPLPRVQGKAGQGTLGKLVADAISAINVGVASLPNPLGPEGSSGGLLLSKLYDFLNDGPPGWGQPNGPPREESAGFPTPGDTPSNISSTGQIGRDGYTTTVTFSHTVYYFQYLWGECVKMSFPPTSGSFTVYTKPTGVRHKGTGTRICGGYDQLTVDLMAGDQVIAALVNASGGGGIISADVSVSFSTNDPAPTDAGSGGATPTPWAPTAPFGGDDFAPIPPDAAPQSPATPAPLPLGALGGGGHALGQSVSPGQEPAAPAPLAPVPTPAYLPAAPPWQSRPGTGTGSRAVPGAFPARSPSQPTLPTSTAGAVAPQPPAAVPTTPAGSVIPWPGAPAIPAQGPAPRADLVGIAQELGRIERKLEYMNTPAKPTFGPDGPLDLVNLARSIWEILSAITAARNYELSSPCEVDANGDPLPPRVVEVAGAVTPFGALYNRIDAIAELLQHHKELKQPVCKGSSPQITGQPVTVTFEEV